MVSLSGKVALYVTAAGVLLPTRCLTQRGLKWRMRGSGRALPR